MRLKNENEKWIQPRAASIAGLPFFWNTLAGNAFYVAMLFGVMALAEKRFPSLREPLAAEAGRELAFR